MILVGKLVPYINLILSLFSIASLGFANISAADAAVLSMYGVIEGYLTVENITSVPSVNSILGIVTNENYTINMFNDPDTGKLKFMGRPIDGIGNVLSATEACNGVVYVTDLIIKPAERASQVLNNYDAIYSVNSIYFNGANCNVSLPDAVAALRILSRGSVPGQKLVHSCSKRYLACFCLLVPEGMLVRRQILPLRFYTTCYEANFALTSLLRPAV